MINEKVWLGILIALITVLGLMATDIYAPAMPTVTQVMSTSANMVQLTVTVFLIAAGLSQLIYGPLSDHWGRRPLLIAGLSIYLMGSILCTSATHLLPLLIGRFIQGLGTGAIMALSRVIIKDAFQGLQLVKALSYIGAFVALSPAIAPALGGFIQMQWGWRWIFGFLLVYSLILNLLAWFTLPETAAVRLTTSPSAKQIIRNYGMIIKNRSFWANVWCSGLAFAAMIVCATVNPFLIENGLGKTPAEYGFWAMISSLGFMIGMLSNTSIVNRFGSPGAIKIGKILILLMALIFIVTGLFHKMSISIIILPTLGIQIGIALVFPNAFLGAITPFPTIMGSAGALYGCIQVAISFITSVVVALISESSQLPMGILLLCIALLGLWLYQRLTH